MSAQEIFEELSKNKLEEKRFFGRSFVTIPASEFEKFQAHFHKTRNWLLNSKVNYRSKHLFKHIHAWQVGETIQFHIDNGNLSKNILMTIPHFLFDVLPHFVACILHLKSPYNTKI